MKFRIVPYNEKYDASIRELERLVIQGKSIQLEIIKDHFLSRSTVYEKYYPCVGVDENDNVLATMVGAKTGIIINGNYSAAGLGYDVKVHPFYRNRGIGREMAKFTSKEFFEKEKFSKNFITLKAFNTPVIRLSRAVRKISLHDFVYLTIPAQTRVTKINVSRAVKQSFSVTLFVNTSLSQTYYTTFKSGLAYFHTYKMYRLNIRYVAPSLKFFFSIMKRIVPKKYAHLPVEKTTLNFATLYNHNSQNIENINEVLDHLEMNGVNYLMVCCRKKDAIYKALKHLSINTFGYYLLADFPLQKQDEVTIDVRCL